MEILENNLKANTWKTSLNIVLGTGAGELIIKISKRCQLDYYSVVFLAERLACSVHYLFGFKLWLWILCWVNAYNRTLTHTHTFSLVPLQRKSFVFIYLNGGKWKQNFYHNVFYLKLKALFVHYMFTFLSWLFDYEKWLDKKAIINFKIDVVAN